MCLTEIDFIISTNILCNCETIYSRIKTEPDLPQRIQFIIIISLIRFLCRSLNFHIFYRMAGPEYTSNHLNLSSRIGILYLFLCFCILLYYNYCVLNTWASRDGECFSAVFWCRNKSTTVKSMKSTFRSRNQIKKHAILMVQYDLAWKKKSLSCDYCAST